jgi:hypothetical protein
MTSKFLTAMPMKSAFLDVMLLVLLLGVFFNFIQHLVFPKYAKLGNRIHFNPEMDRWECT